MKTFKSLYILLFSVMLFWACKDDQEPAPVQDAPIANAGNDAAAVVGVKFELDGSKSMDPKGGAMVYQWAIKTKPQASAAALVNANNVKAAFTADVAGTYTFELTVNTTSKSAKDEVMITVAPPAYTGCVPKSTAITTPTTWAKIAPAGMVDYCVTQDIWVSSTLTIEPGVIIEFEEGKTLHVNNNTGVIKAIGTSSNRIVFTGKQKTKGYWKGIEMNATSNEENEFNYVDISYAGSGTQASGYKAGLSLRSSAKVKVKNTTISHSAGYGLAAPSGVLLEFAQNNFNNNNSAAIFIASSQVVKLDAETQFSANGRNGVEMEGATINYETEQLWPALKDGAKFFILGNVHIYSGVKMQEGAVLEFADSRGIQIEGQNAYLLAKGTAAKKITFSSINKEGGAWKGIEFSGTTHEKNQLDHVNVAYAGSTTHTSGYKAGISSRNSASYSISNSTISNNKGYGIAMHGGKFELFENNTFSNNASAAMIIPPSTIGKLDKASRFKGGNGKEGIEIAGGSIDLNTEQLWPAFTDGGKYFIMENIYIYSGVKIEEGAVVEFGSAKGVLVEGADAYLYAKGTAAKKIIFSGINKTKGYWKGIEFSNARHDKNEFDHCEVSFAGSTTHTNGYKSNISLRNTSNIKLYNTKVSDSNGWGVYAGGTSTVEVDAARPNTYTNNTSGGLQE